MWQALEMSIKSQKFQFYKYIYIYIYKIIQPKKKKKKKGRKLGHIDKLRQFQFPMAHNKLFFLLFIKEYPAQCKLNSDTDIHQIFQG